MKRISIVSLSLALFAISAIARAQQQPELPKPQKEHEWLQQLVGEWTTEGEGQVAPGQTIKCTGTESVKSLGGFWTMSELTSEMMGMSMTGVMTVGYDSTRKKYVGTWVDNCTNHLWKYEGTLDESGKKLTLEAEGPSHSAPGKMANYRDVIEVKGPDEKELTSWMQMDDGKWVQFMTLKYKRKK